MISLKELKKLAVESDLLCHDKSTDKMGAAWPEHVDLTPHFVKFHALLSERLAASPRVVAIVEGGLVQAAFSDDDGVEFSVIDRDNIQDEDTQEDVDNLHRLAGFTDQDDFENKINSGELKPIY